VSVDDNKVIVKRLLDGFNARDWDDVTELFAADYINHDPPSPDAAPDRDGQLAAMQGLIATFADAQAEATHVIAEGELIVVRDKVRGRHVGEFAGIAPTGRDIEAQFIHVYRIVDGKIAERWGVFDAMGVAGLLGA
jgi:predicted ester cyclase